MSSLRNRRTVIVRSASFWADAFGFGVGGTAATAAAVAASSGAAVGLTRAFFVGAKVGEAPGTGVSTIAIEGPAVEAEVAAGSWVGFDAGGGEVGAGAGAETAGGEVGTGGGSLTPFSLLFESARTPSTTARTARRPPPRTKGEKPFFFGGGGAAGTGPFAISSPMRRPVVIVGDSESGTGNGGSGILGRA